MIVVGYGPPLPPFGARGGGTGRIFRARPKERILKKFGKNTYQLYAYSFFPDLVNKYATQLEKTTGKAVIIRSVRDKRVNKGRNVDFGIWLFVRKLLTTKTRRKTKIRK